MQRLRTLREQIDQVKIEIEQAERQYDLNRAAELKYGKLPELERKLQAAEAGWPTSSPASGCSKKKSTKKISPQVVSRWTGVPVSQAAGRGDAEAAASGRRVASSA